MLKSRAEPDSDTTRPATALIPMDLAFAAGVADEDKLSVRVFLAILYDIFIRSEL